MSTTRWVAFLRAMNVGGHTVKNEQLREIFSGLGFVDVDTFIASGNVVFTSPSSDRIELAEKIEQELNTALGYEVLTFLRTLEEVSVIAAHNAFSEELSNGAKVINIGFLKSPLANELVQRYRSEVDEFATHGSEVYWLCRTRQSESPFFKVPFERQMKISATFRNRNTLQRLIAKFSVDD